MRRRRVASEIGAFDNGKRISLFRFSPVALISGAVSVLSVAQDLPFEINEILLPDLVKDILTNEVLLQLSEEAGSGTLQGVLGTCVLHNSELSQSSQGIEEVGHSGLIPSRSWVRLMLGPLVGAFTVTLGCLCYLLSKTVRNSVYILWKEITVVMYKVVTINVLP